jgi:acylphosphatase
MDLARVNIVIKGLVQGVYFRATARQKAHKLNITGWVKNRWDGSVEILAEGEREKLQELIAWCHQGPSGAIVEEVEVDWQPFQDEFLDFTIAY